MIRLILFDAVGTLIYPEPSVAEVYFTLAQQHESRLTKEEIAARFRDIQPQRGPAETDDDREYLRWKEIVARVLHDVTDIDPAFDSLWRHFANGSSWRLFDDVAIAWPALLAMNVPLGVASNFDRRLHGVMREMNLPRLAHIFSSADVGYSKPDTRFFEQVELATNLSPDEILLVGDDLVADAEGAVAAGWRTVWIDRTGRCANQSLPCPRISSLHELNQYLQ